MAYTGATTPNTGTDSARTLSRDVHVGVLEAFKRRTSIIDLLDSRSITGGTGAQFTVEGKEDAADATPTAVVSHTAGTEVSITGSTQDDIIINLDRPQYVARRIDDWDAAVANYDVMAMNKRQVGSKLYNVVDRKAIAAVEAATAATGLVLNGDGHIVTNTTIASATTAKAKGDAICESIYAAAAAIRGEDDYSDLYVALDPVNYSYVVQSDRAVNADFTNGNGGFDTGITKQVGGVWLVQTNNMPATAALEALVFGMQAAGVVKLWDVSADVIDDPQFLKAKRLQGYFSNGMAPLRPQSSAAIKSLQDFLLLTLLGECLRSL